MSVYYLNELYKSFCGIPAYLNGKMTAPIVKKNQIPPIDIIYPSRDTVEDSRLGPPVKTKFLKKKWNRKILKI